MKHARGQYFFLLNPDTLVLNPAIDLFFRYAEAHKDEPIGALGCILFDAHYRPANSYHYFLTPRFLLLEAFGKHHQVRLQAIDEPIKVDFITGADLFIPRRAIERVGMFDPCFFMYCEEVDLEKRMADVGLDRLIIPGPQIVHYDGGSYQPNRGVRHIGGWHKTKANSSTFTSTSAVGASSASRCSSCFAVFRPISTPTIAQPTTSLT